MLNEPFLYVKHYSKLYMYELIWSTQQLFEELQVFSVWREWRELIMKKLKNVFKVTQLVSKDADN